MSAGSMGSDGDRQAASRNGSTGTLFLRFDAVEGSFDILAQVKLRDLARVDFAFVRGLAAYNLVRLPKLLAPPP